MTPEELRRWSAEKVMGWQKLSPFKGWIKEVRESPQELIFADYSGDWLPDQDVNQAFMVVERMRELGWIVTLRGACKSYFVKFEYDGPLNGSPGEAFNDNPKLAILLAAHAALEG